MAGLGPLGEAFITAIEKKPNLLQKTVFGAEKTSLGAVFSGGVEKIAVSSGRTAAIPLGEAFRVTEQAANGTAAITKSVVGLDLGAFSGAGNKAAKTSIFNKGSIGEAFIGGINTTGNIAGDTKGLTAVASAPASEIKAGKYLPGEPIGGDVLEKGSSKTLPNSFKSSQEQVITNNTSGAQDAQVTNLKTKNQRKNFAVNGGVLKNENLCEPLHLTPDEVKALRLYTGTEYRIINAILRDNLQVGAELPSMLTESIKNAQDLFNKGVYHDAIETIRQVFGRVKTNKELNVVRGIGYSNSIDEATSRINQFYESTSRGLAGKGFTSTSEISSLGIIPSGHGNVVLNIKLPEGSPAIPLEGLTQFSKEHEFLLPDGIEFKKCGMVKQLENGMYCQDVELLV